MAISRRSALTVLLSESRVTTTSALISMAETTWIASSGQRPTNPSLAPGRAPYFRGVGRQFISALADFSPLAGRRSGSTTTVQPGLYRSTGRHPEDSAATALSTYFAALPFAVDMIRPRSRVGATSPPIVDSATGPRLKQVDLTRI